MPKEDKKLEVQSTYHKSKVAPPGDLTVIIEYYKSNPQTILLNIAISIVGGIIGAFVSPVLGLIIGFIVLIVCIFILPPAHEKIKEIRK